MSIVMFDKDNCNTCIHKKVCQYQLEKEEAMKQIIEKAKNIPTENASFTMSFNCLNYYKDENSRTNLTTCRGDVSTSTIAEKYYW